MTALDETFLYRLEETLRIGFEVNSSEGNRNALTHLMISDSCQKYFDAKYENWRCVLTMQMARQYIRKDAPPEVKAWVNTHNAEMRGCWCYSRLARFKTKAITARGNLDRAQLLEWHHEELKTRQTSE